MTINCKGQLVDLSSPKVMGILNVTPDSFYDGGNLTGGQQVLEQTEKMLMAGATFIDIGAYSSRPGADDVSEEQELQRIMPAVESLLRRFPDLLLSIDTFRGKVARECVQAGAAMVNDISAGLLDETMLPTVARLRVPYVMMHMRGNPRTMQGRTDYDNLIVDVLKYFSERIAETKALGMADVIIDPGFGFSKTLEQNYGLLSHLELFKNLGRPLLVGLSRKSMIYRLLDTDPQNALNGTTALNMAALLKGANILRVHDVKEAMECVKLAEQMKSEIFS
ncbi:dihydropteroate synthase [Pseudozobellia thermophila]|uniref:Dihydropteroate synthase n=1 Tax=Pseudozobellia thermophila TaxID=192903 RepID=A0A1M6HJD3_9FLAO|nr:dihydropteroate synthase [Pseudozobellia thermophila]SHJ22287.1 dihydropteroate synthase [Pseudozobellia thermophila]